MMTSIPVKHRFIPVSAGSLYLRYLSTDFAQILHIDLGGHRELMNSVQEASLKVVTHVANWPKHKKSIISETAHRISIKIEYVSDIVTAYQNTKL